MQTHSEGNRDYIYYLAIGNARIKEYAVAMKFCKAFLQIEPNNQQAITLEVSIGSHRPLGQYSTNRNNSIAIASSFSIRLSRVRRNTFAKKWIKKRWPVWLWLAVQHLCWVVWWDLDLHWHRESRLFLIRIQIDKLY